MENTKPKMLKQIITVLTNLSQQKHILYTTYRKQNYKDSTNNHVATRPHGKTHDNNQAKCSEAIMVSDFQDMISRKRTNNDINKSRT